MTVDYAGIAAEASGALAEVGAAASIVRTTPGTGYPATGETEMNYTCTVLQRRTTQADRMNVASVGEATVSLMVAADAEVPPKQGDAIIVGGHRYEVLNTMPYQPGGGVLYYICECKSGNV